MLVGYQFGALFIKLKKRYPDGINRLVAYPCIRFVTGCISINHESQLMDNARRDKIKKYLDCDDSDLPSPPVIAVRILEAIKQDDCSLDRLSDIIEMDPALVVKVIRAANSTYYKQITTVDVLTRALSILGLDAVKNIVLSFTLIESINGDDRIVFDIQQFWLRSVTAAVSAELICDLIGAAHKDLFITSLLQDIGLVFMSICCPNRYQRMTAHTDYSQMQTAKAEIHTFGFSHQDVGCYVLENWGFPEHIYLPIGSHHDPHTRSGKWLHESRILHVSNMLSMIYNGMHPLTTVRHAKQLFNRWFGVDAADVDALIDSVGRRTIEMLSLFDIPTGEMKPYPQLLQDANSALASLNLTYEQLLIEYKATIEEAESLAQELKAANLKLRKLAKTDGLTGIYNHRAFQDLLEKRVNEAQRHKRNLTLILLDLDNFKSVKDCHGHLVGDAVLRTISSKISSLLRSEDIFARYGGDEFALILPETDYHGALNTAERIREKIAGLRLTINDTTIRVTVSLGISEMAAGMPEMNKSVLVEMADKALYAAKANGRNAIQFSKLGS